MLQATQSPSLPPPPVAPLPPGWTEHTAPTGHTYYYNAAAGTSTYTRPSSDLPARPPPSAVPPPPYNHFGPTPPPGRHYAPPQHQQRQQRRGPPPDRPKSSHRLPNQKPWVLVKTRLGRSFVHNPETGKSFWKIPAEVKEAVVAFEERERKRREGIDVPDDATSEDEAQKAHEGAEGTHELDRDNGRSRDDGHESEEYEEVIEEVVSEEEEESPAKRPRLESATSNQGEDGAPANQPMELTEADIADQLAQLEQPSDEDLEPGDDPAEVDDQPMTEAEAREQFSSLLDEHKINPYTTWEALIASSQADALIADDRYTLLPNMRSRKSAFQAWSTSAAQKAKEVRAREAKRDPKVAYLQFLHEKASTKLFWPEFRKKYRKESIMNERRLSDKEREKLYRDLVVRLSKKSDSERKDDLWDLMKTVPVNAGWNRDIDFKDASILPDELTGDLRFAALKTGTRERLMKDFIRDLPKAIEALEEDGYEDADKEDVERRRREQALRERERQVERVKRQQMRDQRLGRESLLQEEMELQRAMKVGKTGLKEQLGD